MAHFKENKFIFLLILVMPKVFASDSLTVVVNPGCSSAGLSDEICSKPWLVQVQNEHEHSPRPTGVSDEEMYNMTVYQHLWGGVGVPTIVTTSTAGAHSNIAIDWVAFTTHQPHAILITPPPDNIFGLAITEVILFDDPDDTGNIAGVPADAQLRISASRFTWKHAVTADGVNITSSSSNSSGTIELTLTSTHFDGVLLPEEQKIVVKAFNVVSNRRVDTRPRLLTAPAAAAIDLIFDNLVLNISNPHPSTGPSQRHDHRRVVPVSGFKAARWAAELLLVSNEARPSLSAYAYAAGEEVGFQHHEKRSLDDEYAPGIFMLDEVTTPKARSGSSKNGGYLQWRPVCYLTPGRDVNEATLPHLNRPLPANATGNDTHSSAGDGDSPYYSDDPLVPLVDIDDNLRASLVYSLFGDDIINKSIAAHTVVSFGDSGDGFYTTSNYTVWSLTSGLGHPPEEGLSPTILLVIICGLGLPVLVMVVAGVAVGIWKLRRDRRRRRLDPPLLSQQEEPQQ